MKKEKSAQKLDGKLRKVPLSGLSSLWAKGEELVSTFEIKEGFHGDYLFISTFNTTFLKELGVVYIIPLLIFVLTINPYEIDEQRSGERPKVTQKAS